MAVAFEFRHALAQVVSAADGGGFLQIDFSFVRSLQLRVLEIADASARFQRGFSRVPLQGLDVGKTGAQDELDCGHPGKWPKILERSVDFVYGKRALIA